MHVAKLIAPIDTLIWLLCDQTGNHSTHTHNKKTDWCEQTWDANVENANDYKLIPFN